MGLRNMIGAGRVTRIRDSVKPLQDATMLRRSPTAAFGPKRLKLALQALQFRDARFDVTDMIVQKRIDLTAVFVRGGPKSEQNPDVVQRHVQETAMANERQQLSVLLSISAKVPARPVGFWQQAFMLVIPNRLDSASCAPCKFAYCHMFRTSVSFRLTL